MKDQLNFKIAYALSVLIVCLAGVASAGGLWIKDLYRDSKTIKAAWLGNDLVVLFVIVPLFALVLFFVKRGLAKAKLLWPGLLAFMLYNYAFYLFGAAFNKFFLLYTALFGSSVYALILGVMNINIKTLADKFPERIIVKSICTFLLVMAAPLAIFEISEAIGFIIHGTPPEFPMLIAALDLPFVITPMIVASVLLWKRNPWGYFLSVLMLVKGITYGLVLIAGTAAASDFSVSNKWDPLLPYYLFVFLGSSVGCWLMLRNYSRALPE